MPALRRGSSKARPAASRNLAANIDVLPNCRNTSSFNSAADGVHFEAQVVLTFNAPGRTGMVEKLQLLREQAGNDIRPAAQFDKPAAP